MLQLASDPVSNLRAPNEAQRVQSLRSCGILDTPPEEAFDRCVRLARSLLDMPVGYISLIDSDRQFLKAVAGCDLGSMPRGESICGWTIAQNEPLIVEDLRSDPRFASSSLVAKPPRYRFYAGAPLTDRDGLNIGALCCLDYRPRKLKPEQISLLQDLAQIVVETIEWQRLAMTDCLTGAMTRRAFLEALARDVAQATRHGRLVACLVLDVDRFKAVNDTYGHAAGDHVLRRVSALCREGLRQSDYFGRLGGEEFALMLRDTSVQGALQVAERLRCRIADEAFVMPGGRTANVTVSVGVSNLTAGMDAQALVAAADGALYTAKRTGRNRTALERDMVARLVTASC